MIDRDTLTFMPCRTCWYREGAACFSQRIYNAQVALGKAPPDDGQGALLPHIEIYVGLPTPITEADDEKPCVDYLNKYQVIRSHLPADTEFCHIGDPCQKCGTPHGAVAVGPCSGKEQRHD